MAAITDLLDQVSSSATDRAVVARLASPGKIIGAPSINIDDATNWPTTGTTPVHFAIYKVNASGQKLSTTQSDWKGLLSGTVMSNMTKTGGVDQAYTAGDIVELTPTSGWARDLYTWGNAHGNPDGSLKTAAVKAALGINADPTGGWQILNAGTPPVVSTGYNKGNKEFDLQFTNADLSTVLSPGMRFKVDRTGTVPTQCTDLESTSSQYWSKSSPTGITFTDDFTCEAWIKLESYPTVAGWIVSRLNSVGTAGWGMYVNASGQLIIGGYNITADLATTYQSLPLNTWVHVAATLDVSGTISNTYINGASVPNSYTNAAMTAVAQGGDLAVGRYDGGQYFDGEIAQVRVWSTIRTATQIRDNMAISTVGNETGLVADFKFNGNAIDSTANANNLTAAGGATATTLDNPFKTTEMTEVVAVGYSAPNTTVTVRAPIGYSIPNMVLQNPYYSTNETPFGYPTKSKVIGVIKTSTQNFSGALADWPGQTFTFTAKPNQNYEIELNVPYLNPSVASAFTGYLTDGNNIVLASIRTNTPAAEATGHPPIRAVETVVGGTQTFKARAAVDTGTITANTSTGGFITMTIKEA